MKKNIATIFLCILCMLIFVICLVACTPNNSNQNPDNNSETLSLISVQAFHSLIVAQIILNPIMV